MHLSRTVMEETEELRRRPGARRNVVGIYGGLLFYARQGLGPRAVVLVSRAFCLLLSIEIRCVAGSRGLEDVAGSD